MPGPISARRQPRSWAGRLGLLVLRPLEGRGRWGDRAAGADPVRTGRALAAGALGLLLHPVLGASLAALVWALPAVAARRAQRRRAALIRRELPEAVDLLALAVGAGLTVPLAVEAVARRSGGPVGGALGAAVATAGAGRRLGDALSELPRHLGEEVRPLATTLVGSLRDGSPAADGLDRLAVELRAERRRRAEEVARRVPIKLLFPLVACILPAFALLTVAPLLAGALDALRP
jgi:tight adherence protein C